MNNKGLAADVTELIFVAIAALFLFIFVQVSFSGAVTHQNAAVLGKLEHIQGQQTLLAILELPVEGSLTLADIIILAEDDIYWRGKFAQHTFVILNSSHDPLLKRLKVTFPSSRILPAIMEEGVYARTILAASTNISSLQGQAINIELYRELREEELRQS